MKDFRGPHRIPGGKFLFKLAISLALLFYLLHQVGLGPLWGSLKQAYWPYLLLGLGMVIAGQVLSAFKWKLLLKALGIEPPFGLLVRYYYIGTFFNLFLPGLVGGDFVRGYYLVKEEQKTSTVVLSILTERLLGLLVLLILVRSSLFWYGLPGDLGRSIGQGLSLLLLAALLLGSGLIFGGPLLQAIGRRAPADPPAAAESRRHWVPSGLPGSVLTQALDTLLRLLRDLSRFRSQPVLVGAAMLLILGWQVIFIMVHILVGRSLGFAIPPGYYFVFVPLSVLVSALPISFSGLGVREGSYFYFLSLVQIPGPQAMSFSLLWLSILVASGLFGGMVYLGESRMIAGLARSKEL
ncbi:MAG: flippase-like domain-containing protein [Candidatus Tectomicrobia bacterium]|uniref:Flippase-like domain-containing protein n=1 Tax=Tectimicrobiota bacterium TaxID=2528274 RepID=A0A932CL16_UNCTE|nr:flippase-like domain-containing protein [Candidatus Tectomicrobia bacterium]